MWMIRHDGKSILICYDDIILVLLLMWILFTNKPQYKYFIMLLYYTQIFDTDADLNTWSVDLFWSFIVK